MLPLDLCHPDPADHDADHDAIARRARPAGDADLAPHARLIARDAARGDPQTGRSPQDLTVTLMSQRSKHLPPPEPKKP